MKKGDLLYDIVLYKPESLVSFIIMLLLSFLDYTLLPIPTFIPGEKEIVHKGYLSCIPIKSSF